MQKESDTEKETDTEGNAELKKFIKMHKDVQK